MRLLVLTILGVGLIVFKSMLGRADDTPGFFFGVSNAAFQVEGSPADSDWREWTLTNYPDGTPHIADKTNAERATDFWNRYDEDFRLAEKGGP